MDGFADEQQLSKAVKKGAISEIIQKQAKKISSPSLNDLLIASRRGFKDQVLEALKEGGSAKACSTDKHGRNCLQLAVSHGHFETARGILETGLVDIDAVNKRGLTALHDACSEGHVSIALLLISMGACITAQTKDGWTCLMSACSNGHLKMAKIMVAVGCDLNTSTKLGLTALHIAAWKGQEEVVAMLLHQGSNPLATAHNGKTPQQLALEENQHQCATILTAATNKGSEDPVYRISSLEGQLRNCQGKLSESLRDYQTELARQQLTCRELLEAAQSEHRSEMSQAQEKIEQLERKIAEKELSSSEGQVTATVASQPPLLQSKAQKKRLKKGKDSLTPNTSKSELPSTSSNISVPSPTNTTWSSDTDILRNKRRPKSSSCEDLTSITEKDKAAAVASRTKFPLTPQVSPGNNRKGNEKREGRRESGDKQTITSLVAESLANPSSISSIRRELKSDSFTPKIKKKFPNSSVASSALPALTPKVGGAQVTNESNGKAFSNHRDTFDKLKEIN